MDPAGPAGDQARQHVVRGGPRRRPDIPTAPDPTRRDALSHLTPFRHPVGAVRDACAGAYATARTLYGTPVAVGFAVLAVTVGTRVFRTAGA